MVGLAPSQPPPGGPGGGGPPPMGRGLMGGPGEAPGGPPGGPPGGEGPPDDGPPEEATPEEQDVYDQVVANATQAIYDGDLADKIGEVMKPGEGKYPVEELASIVAPLMMGIEESATEAGAPVTRDMIVQAAMEIIEDIGTELMPSAGLEPLSEEHIEGAFLRTCQMMGAGERTAEPGGPAPGGPPPVPPPPGGPGPGGMPPGGPPPGPPPGPGPGGPPPGRGMIRPPRNGGM